MKAIVQDEYGSPDTLRLTEIDRPEIDDDGVLVRVRATSINPLDWHIMRGLPHVVRMSEGLRRPKIRIRGVDLAGHVEAVGSTVTQFQPGDEVFGERAAALAEYVSAKEDNFAPKPAGITFEQAAAVPCAAYTALQGLRDKGQVQSGQKILVNGASGGVGTFAVQIAKSFGADVTGVCSTRNLELVRSIGANDAIDYTREDFTRNGERYEVILDAVGNRSLSDFTRVLGPDGTLVLAGAADGNWIGPLARPVKAVAVSPFVSQKLVPFLARHSKEDLLALTELIEAGQVTPLIDRTYPLSDAPKAIRYLETRRARGKVVITLARSS
jgi:NADPH:quinone reductase-like Zn-dependent oxidoreductase